MQGSLASDIRGDWFTALALQTAPKNFTGRSGNFYSLGVAPVEEGDWLASYFP
jgi:hypothetical protein